MKKFIGTISAAVCFASSMVAQTTEVQFINNIADPNLTIVDVWYNSTLLLDNVDFRTASPYLTVTTGQIATISIAPSWSASESEATAQFIMSFSDGQKYALVMDGVRGSNFSPVQSIDLKVYTSAVKSTVNASFIDVVFHNGATDAPTLDVLTNDGQETWLSGLAYGDFSNHLLLSSQDYAIRVQNASGTVLGRYDAKFNTLGMSGKGVLILTSGFVNPANNSNGAAFGLWAALPAGGQLIQLAEQNPSAVTRTNDNTLQLTTFPNPVQDKLNIQFAVQTPAETVFSITNAAGKMLYQQELGNLPAGTHARNVYVQNWAAGVYYVTVRTGNQTQTQSIIVTR